MIKLRFLSLLSIVAFAFGICTPVVNAQDEDVEMSDQEEEVLIVTGTRRDDRTNVSSLAPIDVIVGSEFAANSALEMDDLLRSSVPSYQVNWHPIDDAATLVRPATLRGLAPDQTLILVNGIRRHRSGVITFISDALTPGSQGVDLTPIPSLALQRVEVLRDGASAQYGSDAIAGVINFILKEDNSGGSFEARTGQAFEGDGLINRFAGNVGLGFGDTGFVNITAEYYTQDETRRNVERNDVTALIAKRDAVGASTTGLGADTQIWGQPIIHESTNVFVNAGVEISPNASAYAFGNIGQREVEGGFYFRNPDTRNGVFASGGVRLVGAITQEAFDSDACAQYRVAPASASASTEAIQADFDNLAALAADPACFSFNAMFPNGFTPRFGANIFDNSLAVGIKGEYNDNLTYDVSYYNGRNLNEFFIFNTVNAARGPDQPPNHHHRPGDYMQTENSIHADFVMETAPTFIDAPLFIAFGAEWRRETFEVTAGNPYSWSAPNPNDRTAIENLLLQQGFTPASNGFSGFSPTQEGEWSRDNISLYIDFESDFTEDWSGGLALRYEDYEDFGTNTQFKVSLGNAISEDVAWRTTVSTGFRAPTPGQSNVRNVSTEYNAALRDLIETGLIPPTDPISMLKGGLPLEPERSINFSTGLTLGSVGGRVSSIDAFYIKLSDRIGSSGAFSLTEAEVTQLLNQGIAGVTAGSVLRYYTNAWGTRTRGIEIVNSGPLTLPFLDGYTDLTIAASYVDTVVSKRDPDVVSDRRVYNIQNAQPKSRAVGTINHYMGPWRFLVRGSYWGAWSILDSGREFGDDYSARFLTDFEVAYNFEESNLEVVFGVHNVFDQVPNEHPRGVSDSGQLYHEYAPFGGNGGLVYGRVVYSMN